MLESLGVMRGLLASIETLLGPDEPPAGRLEVHPAGGSLVGPDEPHAGARLVLVLMDPAGRRKVLPAGDRSLLSLWLGSIGHCKADPFEIRSEPIGIRSNVSWGGGP